MEGFYKLEYGQSYVAMTYEGGIVYEDLSDLTTEQRDRLCELYNQDCNMDWGQASVIIEKESSGYDNLLPMNYF